MIGLVWRPIVLRGRMTGPLEEFPSLEDISIKEVVRNLLVWKVKLYGGEFRFGHV